MGTIKAIVKCKILLAKNNPQPLISVNVLLSAASDVFPN